MGTNAIISVLSLIIFFSLMSGSLNKLDNRATDNTVGYVKYSTARDVAFSAINLSLKNKELYGTFPISGSVDGGSYVVTGTQSGGTVNLVSTATYADSVYIIKVKFDVYPKPFPGTGAALGLNIDSVNFKMQGSALIDGRNYDSTGTIRTGSGDVAGVTVVDGYDSTKVAGYGGNINGSSDVKVDSALADPASFADEYIVNADSTYTVDFTKSITTFAGNKQWGTAASPKITYVNAGDSTNLAKFTGTIDGWGILVLRGYIQFSGNFTFHGLVINYGDNTLDFSLSTGTPKIIGSMLMGGDSHSTFQMKGNASILYSSSTLSEAKYVGKLLAYHIVDWYE